MKRALDRIRQKKNVCSESKQNFVANVSKWKGTMASVGPELLRSVSAQRVCLEHIIQCNMHRENIWHFLKSSRILSARSVWVYEDAITRCRRASVCFRSRQDALANVKYYFPTSILSSSFLIVAWYYAMTSASILRGCSKHYLWSYLFHVKISKRCKSHICQHNDVTLVRNIYSCLMKPKFTSCIHPNLSIIVELCSEWPQLQRNLSYGIESRTHSSTCVFALPL